MNIFKIPRIYGVSGFGDFNVGQHTVCVAFLALYWSVENKYDEARRDRLVTLALMHDAHEAVVGDILPHFKTPEVRIAVDEIQTDILDAFKISEDVSLKTELKLLDMISFLYEIGCSGVTGFGSTKNKLLKEMYKSQKKEIEKYAEKNKVSKKKLESFLKKINL